MSKDLSRRPILRQHRGAKRFASLTVLGTFELAFDAAFIRSKSEIKNEDLQSLVPDFEHGKGKTFRFLQDEQYRYALMQINGGRSQQQLYTIKHLQEELIEKFDCSPDTVKAKIKVLKASGLIATVKIKHLGSGWNYFDKRIRIILPTPMAKERLNFVDHCVSCAIFRSAAAMKLAYGSEYYELSAKLSVSRVELDTYTVRRRRTASELRSLPYGRSAKRQRRRA